MRLEWNRQRDVESGSVERKRGEKKGCGIWEIKVIMSIYFKRIHGVGTECCIYHLENKHCIVIVNFESKNVKNLTPLFYFHTGSILINKPNSVFSN